MKVLLCAAVIGLAQDARAGCASTQDESTFSVMTFNTWGLPAPIASSRKSRFPRISRMLDEVGVDVVALQEVWRGARPMLRLPFVHYPELKGDTGLAIATNHEITALSAITYEDAVGFDRFKEKGALAAMVTVPGVGQVPVVVTHLQAGRSDRAAGVRASQVDALLAWVAGFTGPAMILGDFNLYDGSALDVRTAGRLASQGYLDAAESLGAGAATYPGLTDRLDRIYARAETADGRCTAARQAGLVHAADGLSDHLALGATLAVSYAP